VLAAVPALFQLEQLLAVWVQHRQAAFLLRGSSWPIGTVDSATTVKQQGHDGLPVGSPSRKVRLDGWPYVCIAHQAATEQQKISLDEVLLLHKAQRFTLSSAARCREHMHCRASTRRACPSRALQVGAELFNLPWGHQMHLQQPGNRTSGGIPAFLQVQALFKKLHVAIHAETQECPCGWRKGQEQRRCIFRPPGLAWQAGRQGHGCELLSSEACTFKKRVHLAAA